MAEAIVRIKNLQKSFGSLEVLKGVGLEVQKGEVVVILGPSGSGKSTMLRCINRLEEPTGGQIFFEDMEITHSSTNINKMRERIGMVFQQFNLFPHMTALENVMEGPVTAKGMKPDHVRPQAADLLQLGNAMVKAKNYEQARAFYEEGLIAAHELGTRQGVAYLQRGLGHVALHYGEHHQAMIYFSQALQYWQGQDMQHPIAGCLAGIAGVAAARDEVERAVQLLGKVDALVTETGPFRSPSDQKEYQQSISLARAHLDEEQYRELHTKGHSMTLEQVIELGVGNLED